jgi:two-component system alkaline phosphatase synthesis response regulator PhoP
MEKQQKILVVDDDRVLQQVITTTLQSKGYETVSAYDGEEGLEKIVDERPDMILLDVIMPKKNGFEVCKELKNDPKYYFFSKIPVLMLTVYPDEREDAHLSMREGMEMDAEDYLHKPFQPAELLNRVERLLSKNREVK